MATATEHKTIVRVIGPRYNRSFASYYIPFRPLEEKSFCATQGFASYSVAYHDSHKRVVRFTKVQLVQPSHEPITISLNGTALPGSTVYFATRDRFAAVSEPIEYPDTAYLTEYFTGTADPSGRSATVVRLMKQAAFTALYTYWPAGRLRERWTIQPGQPERAEFYDARGNRLSERKPFSGFAEYDRGRRALNAGQYLEAQTELTKALDHAEREGYLDGAAIDLMLLAKAYHGEARNAQPVLKAKLEAAIENAKQALPLLQAFDHQSGEKDARAVLADAEHLLNISAKD